MYIFRKTLRLQRLSILIWGIGLTLLTISTGAAYTAIVGGADRAEQIASFKKLMDSFSFLVGKTYDLDTYGGFITVRLLGTTPALVGIYALLLGSGTIRGEEEKGSLDVLLSTPHSRISVMLQKWAGMLVAILGIMFLTWLGLLAGAVAAKSDVNALNGLVAYLNLSLVALFFGTLGLIFGQLTTRRAAAGWAGGLMAATYFMNTIGDTISGLGWMHYLSPFYYYNLSKPLSVTIGTNWGALLLVGGLNVPLLLAALYMYYNRDHNSYFQLVGDGVAMKTERRSTEPKSLWLSNSYLFGLRAALPGAIIWGLGISIYEVIILGSLNGMRESLLELAKTDIYKSLGIFIDSSNESLIHLSFFVGAIVLYAAYAVTQVSGWSGEENEGRLELILSAPEPRWRLLLTRFLVTITASAIMITITGLIFALMTIFSNVQVNTANVLVAFLGLWILCIIIAGIGFLLSALQPGIAVAMLSGLVIISYMADLLGALLKLPEWLINLSVFREYGKPIVTGPDWSVILVMLSISGVFVAGAAFRFQQRDIVK